MEMQQAYAGADLARLEQRLAEVRSENLKLRNALRRIAGINDNPAINPAIYNTEIQAVLRSVLD